MTSAQYWRRWSMAGAAFLLVLALVLHVVVTRPILAALRQSPRVAVGPLDPLRALIDCYSIGYGKPSLKASEVMR